MSIHRGLFCFVLLVPCSLLRAQSDSTYSSQFSFGIGAGPSVPLDEFALFNTTGSPDHNLAGHAANGRQLRLMAQYDVSRIIGIYLAGMQGTNEAVTPDRQSLIREPFPPALGGGYIVRSYTYGPGTWRHTSLVLGVVLHGPKERVMPQLRFGAGIQWAQSPEADLTVQGEQWEIDWPTTRPYTSTTHQSAMRSQARVLDLGLDVKGTFGKHWSAWVSADLFTADHLFQGSRSYGPVHAGTAYTTSGTESFRQRIFFAAFTASMGYCWR